jgi:hypothetical protein
MSIDGAISRNLRPLKRVIYKKFYDDGSENYTGLNGNYAIQVDGTFNSGVVTVNGRNNPDQSFLPIAGLSFSSAGVGSFTWLGEIQLSVASAAAEGTLINSQDETDYDDSPATEGIFFPGDAYVHDEVITLSDATDVTVDDVTDAKPIDSQDETSYDNTGNNGTFTAGSGYIATEVITLSDGTTVTVDAESAGAVTEFTVDSDASTKGLDPSDVLTQDSTDGSGTGFDLTVGLDNLAGEVSEFTVDNTSSTAAVLGDKLTQSSTTGSGTGFHLKPGADNITTLIEVFVSEFPPL